MRKIYGWNPNGCRYEMSEVLVSSRYNLEEVEALYAGESIEREDGSLEWLSEELIEE